MCYLPALPPAPVKPPDAVASLPIQPRRHLGCHERLDFLKGVRAVHVVVHNVADGLLGPIPGAGRTPDALTLEDARSGMHRQAFHTDHLEDAPDGVDGLLVDQVVVTGGVKPKAILRKLYGHHLAFACLSELPAPGPLGYLRPLVLGELVEYAVGEFPFRALVPPVVEGADLGAVLLELPL